MNRDQLAALVNPLKTAPISATLDVEAKSDPVRDALVSYFASPEGIADLADAPRVNGKQMTVEEAIDALVEEARAMEQT